MVARPIDIHLKGSSDFGAVKVSHEGTKDPKE